jgi:cullin 3
MLITKLKELRGKHLIYKFEGMLDDLSNRLDINKQGLQVYEYVNMVILTKSFWPTQRIAFCELPDDLEDSKNACFDYWTKNNPHSQADKMRLEWQPNLEICIISATFGEKTYTIKLSTYQMVVLYQFNTCDSLTFLELHKATRIPNSDLEKELFTLLRYGLVVDREKSYSINEGFLFRSSAFEIMPYSMGELEKKEKRIEMIDNHRRELIEACVVRTMKQNRVMDENELVTSVIRTLSEGFSANKGIIETRIRVLLEKNYLIRKDEGVYEYVP